MPYYAWHPRECSLNLSLCARLAGRGKGRGGGLFVQTLCVGCQGGNLI